tara:strand:- start:328 stop:1200 length:873 start_codon:yes stop_codon:yes gene_type:complete
MRSFLVKVLLFFSFPIFLHCAILVVAKQNLIYNLKNSERIILGDSQTKFIDLEGTFNRSTDGSPYFIHYFFVKEFINEIKGKEVYIALNYHNLSNLYQNRLSKKTIKNIGEGWSEKQFKILDAHRLFNCKYPELRPIHLDYRPFDIKKVISLVEKEYEKRIPNTIVFVEDTLTINTAIKRHFYNPEYILDDSIQRSYLNKLIRILKNNDCNVVFLKMPLTSYYYNNVPYTIQGDLIEVSIENNVRILDLNDSLKISKNYNYFKDYGHLNKSGDEIIKQYLIESVIENSKP